MGSSSWPKACSRMPKPRSPTTVYAFPTRTSSWKCAKPGLEMSALPQGLSVVIPVYNSAESLPRLVDRLAPVLRAIGSRHELVLVNDGSRDNSWSIIEQLAAQH